MDVDVQALQGSVVAPVEGRRVPHLLYRRLAVSVGDCDAAAALARARRALADAGAQRGVDEAKTTQALLLDCVQSMLADVHVEQERAQRIEVAVHASAAGDVQLARRAWKVVFDERRQLRAVRERGEP